MNDLKSAEYSPVPALVGKAVGFGVGLGELVPPQAAAQGKYALLQRIRRGRVDCR